MVFFVKSSPRPSFEFESASQETGVALVSEGSPFLGALGAFRAFMALKKG